MNTLSLFDWPSTLRVALDRAGIPVTSYYASEIDKYAMQIAKKNYSDTVQVWDVKDVLQKYDWYWTTWLEYVKIDLLVWWSPCQDLSIAKKDRKGLEWPKSSLFREYVRILEETKPKYFVLENVASMPKEAKEIITNTLLEIYPDTVCHMINASLVSAQNRKRLFRTNIQWIEQPQDRGILLKDILDDGANHIYNTPRWFNKWGVKEWKAPTMWSNCYQENNKVLILWNTHPSGRWMNGNVYWVEGKSPTLTTNKWEWNKILDWEIRKLTPIECERLQWLPDNYTEGVSNSQRYKMLWNAFNVDVVAHILSFIPPR